LCSARQPVGGALHRQQLGSVAHRLRLDGGEPSGCRARVGLRAMQAQVEGYRAGNPLPPSRPTVPPGPGLTNASRGGGVQVYRVGHLSLPSLGQTST